MLTSLLLLPWVIAVSQSADSVKKVSVLPKSNVSDQAALLENKIRFEKEKSTSRELINYSLTQLQQQQPQQQQTAPNNDVQNKELNQKQQEMQVFKEQSERLVQISNISPLRALLSPSTMSELKDEAELAVSGDGSVTARQKRNKAFTPAAVDSRVEINALNALITWQLQALNDARSVGLIIRRSAIHSLNDSLYQISTGITLKQKYQLCGGEKFAEQPVAGEGTGFLVSGQEMITAAHVINGPLSDYALVFGFQILNKQGGFIPIIPKKDIYYLTDLSYRDNQIDLLRIKLDRMTDRPALTLGKYSPPTIGTEVYMLGYPAGLPMKAAINASITSIDQATSFYTSLDAFQGNSGSPVISLNTNEVIGILVAGRTDFIWNGSCNISASCNIPYCKGEKVLRIPKALCPTGTP